MNAAGIPWFVTGLTLIARAADACAGSSTVVLTSELNPTSVRQLAMGILSACNGFGGVIAPFLNEFLVRISLCDYFYILFYKIAGDLFK